MTLDAYQSVPAEGASQTVRRRNVAITNDIRGGSWAIEPTLDGVKTVLAADFDFGVPSMASIVEPVAERC